MPPRYWERVRKSELIWGLQTVHAYFEKVAQAKFGKSGQIVAGAQHCPERGFTKVLLCAQDKPGLLAKTAAAFSALRINILRAEVYTRSDGLALDLFEVCETEHSKTDFGRRLDEFVFLLEGALSEPPRFVSIWASQFHKLLVPPKRVVPEVEFDNASSNEYTIAAVRAADRLGLLHDLLQCFTDCAINIDQAVIETEDHRALDRFYLSDFKRQKIVDPQRLEALRRALLSAIDP
jgi:[protein-PII] uridylyltransferase